MLRYCELGKLGLEADPFGRSNGSWELSARVDASAPRTPRLKRTKGCSRPQGQMGNQLDDPKHGSFADEFHECSLPDDGLCQPSRLT